MARLSCFPFGISPKIASCTLLASALTFTLSAQAQQLPSSSSQISNASAARLKVPARIGSFETTPRSIALREGLVKETSSTPNNPVPTYSHVTLPPKKVAAPWVLPSDLHPGVLTASSLIPVNGLVFSLPSPTEARMLLPGRASEMADRARTVASRYEISNIGSATLIRSRQLEAVASWAAATSKQKTLLPPHDKWAAYQFNLEALDALTGFKRTVYAQSAPQIAQVTQDLQRSIRKISAVMAEAAAYEQKMRWYDVLVQLKEGFARYQARVALADSKIFDVIEAFERNNPPINQPQGAIPPKQGVARFQRQAPVVKPTNLARSSRVQRTVAQPVVQSPGSSSAAGGLIVLGAFALAGLWVFFRLRGRLSRKKAQTNSPSE